MDTLTPQQRSERMSRVRGKDTKPELLVRGALWARGYRYRLHGQKLPGKPDLVFKSRQKVIFVHGCFWHRHGGCALARLPKSRLEFWERKLEGNRQRDERNLARLKENGWSVLVIWECELANLQRVIEKASSFLDSGTEELG